MIYLKSVTKLAFFTEKTEDGRGRRLKNWIWQVDGRTKWWLYYISFFS